jgi:hypothetical protein
LKLINFLLVRQHKVGSVIFRFAVKFYHDEGGPGFGSINKILCIRIESFSNRLTFHKKSNKNRCSIKKKNCYYLTIPGEKTQDLSSQSYLRMRKKLHGYQWYATLIYRKNQGREFASLSCVMAYPDPAFHFNADPDPAFHFNANADPDPAPNQSDANLRPLVYRTSRAPF